MNGIEKSTNLVFKADFLGNVVKHLNKWDNFQYLSWYPYFEHIMKY